MSALDFCYFSSAFFFKKVNFVVAENMKYSTPLFAKMITGYRCILKKQYYSDFSCIKNIKKYLDAGISVCLCPEGKVAAEGKTGVIPSSIAKLVKWLGYPVATIVTTGAGLTRPKWAHTLRRGRVDSYCDMLFDIETLTAASQDEVMDKIKKALYLNEHTYQLEKGTRFYGTRYAEGLERLLYRCPKCGEEFVTTSKGDTLTCEKCKNTVRYSKKGGLHPIGDSLCPERIDLWYDLEREAVAREIEEDGFRMEYPVHLFVENEKKDGYKFVASGSLALDKTEIAFKSTMTERPKKVDTEYKIGDMELVFDKDCETEPVEDEFMTISMPVKNLVTVANIPGTSVDLYDEKHTYRMIFARELGATKYALAIEEMARLRGERQ
jgi:ribosomal protein S27AE